MNRLGLIVCLALTVACGGQRSRGGPAGTGAGSVPTSTTALAGSMTPEWLEGALPAQFDEATHLMVVGRGTTVEAAEADAREKMMAAVLGPETARPFLTVPDALQDFAYTPGTERYVDPEGEAFVRLIAQRVFIVDRLKSWEVLMARGALSDEQPEAFVASGQAVTDPSTHLEALAATLGARRATVYVCERRMAVTTSTCTPGGLETIRKAVKTFGRSVQLRPRFTEGVPYRVGHGPEAGIAIEAVWSSPGRPAVVLSGLPLMFKGPSEETSLETDDKGRAEWKPGVIDPATRVAVRIHSEAVLASEASLWAALPAIEVGFRGLGVKTARMAFLIDESSGQKGRDGFKQKLTTLGMRSPVQLEPRFEGFVKGGTDRERLRAMAEAAGGSIDLVAVGEMHSQYAGKLGARSVWHEAEGTITVYDVWSGAQIGPVKGTDREHGIGERAASAKALGALGRHLAEELTKLLNEHYRPSATALNQ